MKANQEYPQQGNTWLDYAMEAPVAPPKRPKVFRRRPAGRKGLDRSYRVPVAPEGQIYLPLGRDPDGIERNVLVDVDQLHLLDGFCWSYHPIAGAIAHINNKNRTLTRPYKNGKYRKIELMHRRLVPATNKQVIRINGNHLDNRRCNLALGRKGRGKPRIEEPTGPMDCVVGANGSARPTQVPDRGHMAPKQPVKDLDRMTVTVELATGQKVSAYMLRGQVLEIQVRQNELNLGWDDLTFKLVG